MKVIHLISGGDTGGAKTHVQSLLSGLAKEIGVTLVCFMRGDFYQEALDLGINTSLFEGNNPFRTLKKLKRHISNGEYDLIHCHGSRGNLMGALLKPFFSIPVISTVHSDYRLDYLGRPLARLIYGSLNAAALRRMDYLIGVSEHMKRCLISRGFQPNSLFSIYNGMDFSKSVEQEAGDCLGELGLDTDEDSVVVGIAARLDPVKDLPTLIRAFAAAYGENKNLRLVIAGSGQELGNLQLLTASLGLQHVVCFAGWIRSMDRFYSSIHVNALTSVSETFPYVLTEGAVYKLPTVSSRVGGVPDLIISGKTGLLFEPGDDKALAGHLIALAGSRELRDRLGLALYEKASAEFSETATCQRQLEIYRTVLRRRGKTARGQRQDVMICGAYGHGNAGDDAILEAIIKGIHSIDEDIRVTVLTRRPYETRAKYGVNTLYTFNLPSVFRRMNKTKLFISGGGSLIQNVTSRRSLWYYLLTIAQAKKRGNRVIMYGCGIGPVYYRADRRLVRRILDKHVDIITLREDQSLRELAEIGVTRPEMILSSDPALTISPADEDLIDNLFIKNGLDPRGRYICFAPRRWHGLGGWAQSFSAAAEHAYKKYGLTPIFLSINHRSDGEAAEKICQGLKAPYYIFREPMDSSLAIGLISRMAALVSVRLHGLIFGAGQGVPLVGIAYDQKVTAFLNYIGQENHVPLQDLSTEKLIGMVDAALSLSGEKEKLKEATAKLLEIEVRNVRAARRLLEG